MPNVDFEYDPHNSLLHVIQQPRAWSEISTYLYHKHNIHKVYLHYGFAKEGWKIQNVTFAYVRLNSQAVTTVMRRRSTED